MYDRHDLLRHLVTVHRLGVCGFDRGGPDHRLRLPKADDPPDVPGHKRPFSAVEGEPPSSGSSRVAGRKRPRRNADVVECFLAPPDPLSS